MIFNANNRLAWRSAAPGLCVAALLSSLIICLLLTLFNTTGGQLELPQRSWTTLRISAMQAALSTFVSVGLGLALAWALSHQRMFFGRRLLLSFLSVSLVLPTLVVILGIVSVYGRAGWLSDLLALLGSTTRLNIYGLSGIVLAHSYFNGAFAARQLLLQLEAIPAEKRKLAHSLGLGPWQRFKLLEWPATIGALPTLTTTIFMLCFSSFATVLVLGGSPRYNTLEVAIYEALKLDFAPTRAVALALLQLAVCGVLVLFSTFSSNSSSSAISGVDVPCFEQSSREQRLQWAIISSACLFLLLPLAAVVSNGIASNLGVLLADAKLQRATWISISTAAISSSLVILSSVVLVRASTTLSTPFGLGGRRWSQLLRMSVSFAAVVYLAVPSLVLGLGFFLVARQLPGRLENWAWFALIAANTLMALPFAVALLLPAAHKANTKYARLVYSLNLQGWQRWCFVDWPMLRRPIGQVAAISFCLSLGDMGVIALFGSHELTTLPWLLYQKFGSYRTLDAAGIALILLCLTLFVFNVLPTVFHREEPRANT